MLPMRSAFLVVPLALTSLLGQSPQFRQQGRAQFDQPTNGPVNPYGISQLDLADTDGDGDLDVFAQVDIGGGGPYSYYVYHNDGRGHFGSRTYLNLPPIPWQGRSYATPDLNGDGIVDIIFVAGSTSLWLSIGSEAWVQHALPPINEPPVFGDFDGDGDTDIFSASPWSPGSPIRLLRNDAGTFVDVSVAWFGSQTATTLMLGDVDGDGDLDVFTESRLLFHDSALQRYVPAPPGYVPASYVNGRGVLTDVDGDGDLDLLGDESSRTLMINLVGGIYIDRSSWLPTIGRNVQVQVQDLTGDGRADLLVDRQVYANDGTGHFGVATGFALRDLGFTQWPPPMSLAFGDVNGDGKPDVVGCTFGQRSGTSNTWGTTTLAINDRGMRFVETTSSGIGRNETITLTAVAADFDGDGDSDLVLLGTGWARNDWGSFESPVAVPLPRAFAGLQSLQTQLPFAADLDGDGDLDLVGSMAETWINVGGGTLQNESATRVPPGVVPFWTGSNVAGGDIDGDGDVDLVATSPEVVLRNNGSGFFQIVPGALPPLLDQIGTFLLGDFDRDGDLDVFAQLGSYAVGNQDRMLLNDGMGHFVELPAALPPYGSIGLLGDAISGDFDGDGDIDIVVVGRGVMYRNAGNATFSVTPVPTGTMAAAADVDEDGDLDLLIGSGSFAGNGGGGGIGLYQNDGTGTFAGAPITYAPMGPVNRILAFDCDGDRDLDVVVTTEPAGLSPGAVDLLFINQQRNLTAPNHPQIGAPYNLHVLSGDATASPHAALLAVGPPLTPRPFIAPLGSLALDLNSSFIVGFRILPTTPTPTPDFTIQVPYLPALLGAEFAFQALVGPAATYLTAARLTNALVEPILF